MIEHRHKRKHPARKRHDMTSNTIDYAKLSDDAADTHASARDDHNRATLHDLISRWNEACDETFISNSDFNFTRTSDAAAAIGRRHEDRFRENRSFRNEERMRHWRMVAAKELDKRDGQSTRGAFHTHPAWLARRNEYTMRLHRSPNLKEKPRGFPTLTYGQQAFFGLTGGALLTLSPVITLINVNPQ